MKKILPYLVALSLMLFSINCTAMTVADTFSEIDTNKTTPPIKIKYVPPPPAKKEGQIKIIELENKKPSDNAATDTDKKE